MVQTATKKAFRRKVKETLYTMWTWSRLKKNWRLNCFFRKDVKLCDWNVLVFTLRNDIQNRYSKDFVIKTKQKRIEKIIFPFGNKIYIQSSLDLKGWTWRWFLRKLIDLKLLYERLLSKNMNSSKLSLVLRTSPPLSHGDRISSCSKISADHWNCRSNKD